MPYTLESLKESALEECFDSFLEDYLLLDEAIYGSDCYEEIERCVYTADDTIILLDDSIYCESDSQYYLDGSEDIAEINGSYYLNTDDHIVIDSNREYQFSEDCSFCEDTQEYVLSDYAYYCDLTDCYYEHQENMPCNDGKEFICEYHSTKRRGYEKIVTHYKAKNSAFVGFEIEKNDHFGDSHQGAEVGEYEILAGIEQDGSCGIEYITQPIQANDIKINRRIFELFNEIDEILSQPSDTSCGGHINLSIEGVSPEKLFNYFKPYASIFYALYKWRLKNNFCNSNLKLEWEKNTKYSPIQITHFGIEIRLPSRVGSLKTLQFRFLLMQRIVQHIKKDVYELKNADKSKKSQNFIMENQDLFLMVYDHKKILKLRQFNRYFFEYLQFGTTNNKIQGYL